MSLLSRITQRLKRDFFRFNFNRKVQLILDTPPLKQGTLEFTLLSMVHKRDVYAYLVAVKSFTRYANPERIVMVCDPSIDDADKHIIGTQIPHIEFRRAEEFTHPDIPRGGCWERLFAITDYSKSSYVVQLDADTVTQGDIPEVINSIRTKHGFVLGEEPDQSILTFQQAAAISAPWQSPTVHIQGLAEFVMQDAELPKPHYVRGCAGFTGFPESPSMRDDLILFSQRMAAKTPGRWAEWGTEQVASNYLVANAFGTTVLPYPKYATPDQPPIQTVFLHFIGSMRFINQKYEIAARQIIAALKA